ncbi:39S ribosomal protein L55, mitochondrial [Galendromus occidentalis]|uniref:39S ribosomal protein L55, mitochondrial n=1 Tax=Galendromus occidentalis TaxID=34638 RepID=A0AAJ6QRR8_9ACAR|nr:39S ribosomal protein L55, mitochondrial [Galendromus occidentalis]
MAAPMSGVCKRFFHLYRPLQNTNEAFITRPKRSVYVRTYPTTLIQPDGSTFTIRYHEPIQAITLPLDFDALTPEEQKMVLLSRRPKEKAAKVEELKVGFDAKKYLKYRPDGKKRS